MPTVVKSNGQREDFSRKKIETSFHRALHKRAVSEELIAAAVERIEQTLLNDAKRELASRKVGEMVMAELKKLDEVGYVRFASVYRSFSDAEEFKAAIREVQKG